MIEYSYEKSIFDVKRMTSGTIDGCPDITYQQINSFNAKNYVFAVCPFGVLILGHKDVPENNMKFEIVSVLAYKRIFELLGVGVNKSQLR